MARRKASKAPRPEPDVEKIEAQEAQDLPDRTVLSLLDPSELVGLGPIGVPQAGQPGVGTLPGGTAGAPPVPANPTQPAQLPASNALDLLHNNAPPLPASSTPTTSSVSKT